MSLRVDDAVACIERHARLKSLIFEAHAIAQASLEAARLDFSRAARARKLAEKLAEIEKKVDEEHDCKQTTYIKLRGTIMQAYHEAIDILRESLLKEYSPRNEKT
ncbi:MAG: hypothetical protein QXS85_00005 [Acidilobaceae archaeon]